MQKPSTKLTQITQQRCNSAHSMPVLCSHDMKNGRNGMLLASQSTVVALENSSN